MCFCVRIYSLLNFNHLICLYSLLRPKFFVYGWYLISSCAAKRSQCMHYLSNVVWHEGFLLHFHGIRFSAATILKICSFLWAYQSAPLMYILPSKCFITILVLETPTIITRDLAQLSYNKRYYGNIWRF